MAGKSKRREWTASDVRTLKTLRAKEIEWRASPNSEANQKRDPAKSVQSRSPSTRAPEIRH